MHNQPQNRARLKQILDQSGLRAALQFLNSLSNHRFTALYRFADTQLKNLHLYDRQNPEKETMPEIPVLASYCVFVRDTGRNFCVENSLQDQRTVNHPKRLEIQAYCGVPLLDQYGRMFGTICHFDVDPRATQTADIDLMEEMATLLQSQIDPASISTLK